jgi:hypothetical protein
MLYDLKVKELTDTAVEVAAADEASLVVVRDETRLHGYAVGDIKRSANGFDFRAESDEPGKVREFLMGLTDVRVRG